MTTPLSLSRRLRLAFPEFQAVMIVREGPYRLRAFCLISSHHQVSEAKLAEWISSNKAAATLFEVDQVDTLPADVEDDASLLRKTPLRLEDVEDADVTAAGLERALRNTFPGEVLAISDANGCISVHVRQGTTPPREEVILTSTRLLLTCDPNLLEVTQAEPLTGRRITKNKNITQSSQALTLADQDRLLLHDNLTKAISGDLATIEQPLPSGSSTYASAINGVNNLFHQLALFDNVFVSVPLKEEEFVKHLSVTQKDFIDALPTGRIIPVFPFPLSRYDNGVFERIVDSGAPRVLLQGEATLRAIHAVTSEHLLLREIEAGTDEIRSLRIALNNYPDNESLLLRGYLDALAELSARIRYSVKQGPALSIAWYAMANWLDETLGKYLGIPSRSLELTTALDYRIMNQALNGTPLTVEGHFLDPYLQFLYGATPGDSPIIQIKKPEIIGKICFPDTDTFSLRDFAETFNSSAIKAMRSLMKSRRLEQVTEGSDIVKQFNAEYRQYARRVDAGYTAFGVLLAVGGLIGPLGIPAALAYLGVELAKRVLEREAPNTLAKFGAAVTRTTKEGALMAQIKKSL